MLSDIAKALLPKSDQLNADCLISGSITVRVRAVDVDNSRQAQKIWVYYDGDDDKPFKPCVTMGRCMALIWGDKEKDWVGKSMTLHRDENVDFGNNKNIGGVRISHIEGIDRKTVLKLTKTRGKKGDIVLMPLFTDAEKVDVADVLRDAMGAANKGKASFTKWWQENKDKQHMVKDKMDDFKKAAADFDDGGAM